MFKSLIIFLCLLCVSASAFAEEKPIHLLSQTCKAFESPLADRVWPGFQLNRTPIVAYFKNGHVYAFYLEPSAPWKALSRLHANLQFSEKDHWGLTQVPLHPAFPIGKQKAFVFCLDMNVKNNVELPLLVFLHERFHLYQFERFNRYEERTANDQDEWNEENQALMALENWLLVQFLKDKCPEQRIEYLKDFMAVNHHRYQQLHLSSKLWEDLQQRMEGLADYVSIKTYETFPLLEAFNPEECLLKAREQKQGKDFSILSDAVKGRHYFVGATLGFALDFCQKQWKVRVEKGEPLRLLLAEALSLSSKEMTHRLMDLTSSAAYQAIRSDVQQSLAGEKERIDQVVKSYESADGVSIGLAAPKRPMSGGGKIYQRYFLGNGETICLGDTSVSSSYDQRWNLSFKSIPFVIEDRTGVRTFKLETNAEIYIDCEPVCLGRLQQQFLALPFYSLAWNDKHSQFESNLPGTLYVENGEIFIEFE